MKNAMTSRTVYLQSLQSIRDRCEAIYAATQDEHPAACFSLDETKLDAVVDFVAAIILRDYRDVSRDVPPHGRWRHFLPAGSVEATLLEPMQQLGWSRIDSARTVIDLFVVSVLLDAGAGSSWKYRRTGLTGELAAVGRSEGLAMASMDMFLRGLFSGENSELDCRCRWRADARGLETLTVESLAAGLQVDSDANPLVGLEGRVELLQRLGRVLSDPKNARFFAGPTADESPRPGNLVFWLLQHGRDLDDGSEVDLAVLWQVIIEGFGGVWPSAGRVTLDGVSLGDVWPSALLRTEADDAGLVPFHKLSQWLTYSIMEPLERILRIQFRGTEQLTGLAEYRNGGLFVDFDVVKLKAPWNQNANPSFPPGHEVIVQWRALTVCLLDRLAPRLCVRLGLGPTELSLPKVLEGGTWKAGREIAARLRPATCAPPIAILSDGTVF